MKRDPLVEEIHRFREAHSTAHNHDLWSIYAELKKEEEASGRSFVSCEQPPRDPAEDGFELTPELRVELDRRIANHEANPDAGFAWEEVRAGLRSRSSRPPVGGTSVSETDL